MEDHVVKDNYKFVVSGDSISKGVVYDEEKCKYTILEDNYVALIQNRLKGIICNTAKFGNTVIKGLGKLQKDVLKNNPDIVLIEYGGNDCDFNWNEIAENPDVPHSPKTEFNTFKITLKDSIKLLVDNKITPVLMTLPPLDADRYFKWVSRNNPVMETNIHKWLGSITKIYWWQERYNSAITSIAQETHTKLIDIRSAFLEHADFAGFLCIDGIHPNSEGHKVIAGKVMEFIKSSYGYLLVNGADTGCGSYT